MGGYAFLEGIKKNTNTYSLIMDRAFFPYGKKDYDFLYKRTIFLCKYLLDLHVDEIIIACNTLSIMVLDDIKKLFSIKITGVIELLDLNIDNALFMGTTNTINALKPIHKSLDYFDGSELIALIQNNKNKEIKDYMKKNRNLFNSYQYVILGCTHFIKIKHMFKNYISQDEEFMKRYSAS